MARPRVRIVHGHEPRDAHVYVVAEDGTETEITDLVRSAQWNAGHGQFPMVKLELYHAAADVFGDLAEVTVLDRPDTP